MNRHDRRAADAAARTAGTKPAKSPIKLIGYPLAPSIPTLRPAPPTRAWMDETPGQYAYRCLPLNIANALGWQLLVSVGFTATWDGGIPRGSVRIEPDEPHFLNPTSHFGSGIITFNLGLLFRTEPAKVCMLATAPLNMPKDGASGLTGVIETGSAPSPFTYNWSLTRPGHPVRFEKDEPICQLVPLEPERIEAIEPELRDLNSAPALRDAYGKWLNSRGRFLRELPVPGTVANAKGWQKTYFQGRSSDDSEERWEHHRTKLRQRAFKTVI